MNEEKIKESLVEYPDEFKAEPDMQYQSTKPG